MIAADGHSDFPIFDSDYLLARRFVLKEQTSVDRHRKMGLPQRDCAGFAPDFPRNRPLYKQRPCNSNLFSYAVSIAEGRTDVNRGFSSHPVKQYAMNMESPLKDHFVICGLGHVGYRIAELLIHFQETFVVITREARPEWHGVVEGRAARFIVGNARHASCLAKADIEHARAVIVVTDNDLTNIEICLDVQRLFPAVPLVVRIFDRFLADRAQREMRVRNILSPGLLSAPVFAAAAQGEEMIRTFDIAGTRLNVFELAFTETAGVSIASLADFCAKRRLIPLSLARTGWADVPAALDTPVCPGDRIVAIAGGAATEKLRRDGFLPRHETLSERRKPLRRLWDLLQDPVEPFRSLAATWRRTSPALRTAFFILHGLFLLSVFIFHQYLPGH